MQKLKHEEVNGKKEGKRNPTRSYNKKKKKIVEILSGKI